MAGKIKVAIGIVYGNFEPDFVFSLLALKSWDQKNRQLLDHEGWVIAQQGTNLPQQRNTIVKAFLETNADWLWFIDTDQRFRYDILDRLVDSADQEKRPILSGLVMAEKTAPFYRIVPACMGFESLDPITPREYRTIPKERHWTVGAVGSGCLLVHRSVYEKMAEAHKLDAQPFYKYSQWEFTDPDTGKTVPDIMGEDYVFSLRAQALGFPCVVDTTIEAGHIKKRTLTTKDFWPQISPEEIPTKNFVVIPMKDKVKLTKKLVNDLAAQNQTDGILILDNGSKQPETIKWLREQKVAEVANAAGLNIHEMWNAGAAWAKAQHPRFNLAILNNDLEVGQNFIGGLAEALRSDDQLVAVCPNYDDRQAVEDVMQLHGICAGRYDGTGGLAGFAFMVKSEWFDTGWRFPTDCQWWFGDNDFTLSVDMAGGWYALVTNVKVKHLDGGGKTGNWDNPEMQKVLAQDKAAFVRKWSRHGVAVQ